VKSTGFSKLSLTFGKTDIAKTGELMYASVMLTFSRSELLLENKQNTVF